MYPLHYGNFGGLFIKILWAWLGLTTALLPISGMMLWVERGKNAREPAYSKGTYEGVLRLLIGSCGGVVVATAVLFPAQLILNNISLTANHTSTLFALFFGAWLIALALGIGLKRHLSMKLLSVLTAICLIITMPLDAALTGSHLFNMFDNQHFVSVGVDITLFVMGLGLLLMIKNTNKQKITISDEQPNAPQQAVSN